MDEVTRCQEMGIAISYSNIRVVDKMKVVNNTTLTLFIRMLIRALT